MNSMKRRVQGRPLDLVRSLSAAGKQVFTTDDARKYLPEDAALWLALTRLQKTGWIKRLKRGVYLIVPLEAGVERQWTEDAFVVACFLAQPAAVAYWSAMRHWNWTTQVPQTVFVQTTQRKSAYKRIVLGVTYRFIPVVPKKFFGIRRERIGAKMFSVTDRENPPGYPGPTGPVRWNAGGPERSPYGNNPSGMGTAGRPSQEVSQSGRPEAVGGPSRGHGPPYPKPRGAAPPLAPDGFRRDCAPRSGRAADRRANPNRMGDAR
jgi:hypothetical protein